MSHQCTRQDHILIVGDPALSQGLMRNVLAHLRYSVTCVESASEALACLNQASYNLALVALRTSDGHGPALVADIRHSRGAHRRMPIIVFGDAWDRESVQHECRAAGAQLYLEKPISIARLLRAIRNLLDIEPTSTPGRTMPMPLDIAHFADITDGDRQMERELAALFVSTASVYLGRMEAALSGGGDWSAAAHSLKGASANIGAGPTAEIAGRAEHGEPSQELLDELRASLECVREALCQRIDGDAEETLPAIA